MSENSLIDIIEAQLTSDDADRKKQSDYLIQAYEESEDPDSINKFLIALCGWSIDAIQRIQKTTPSDSQSPQDALQDPRIRALAIHLDTKPKNIIEFGDAAYGQPLYHSAEEVFLVLTDKEADQALSESLDSYLEECIYPQIPEELRIYFDADFWKQEAAYDGRGHCLSTYDGQEHEQGNYFIYRID